MSSHHTLDTHSKYQVISAYILLAKGIPLTFRRKRTGICVPLKSLKTRQIISLKEARKLLGVSSDAISDDDLMVMIVNMTSVSSKMLEKASSKKPLGI